MDFEHESLLEWFLGGDEEEKQKIIEWNNANGHERSAIFEYRLETADKLRDEGNDAFKEADYPTARHRYYSAVWHLDFDIGQQWNLMEHHQKDLDTRKLKVIGNVCASYLKEGDWVNTKRAADIGLRHMEKASLKDDEATAKFLYRKGYANLERGFCEDAFEALKKAEKLLPGDKQVRHALKLAGEGKKIDREKAKEVYRAVLLTDEEKACRGPDWHWGAVAARYRAICRRFCCRRKTA
jgi:tetratricopeptide (TPR) repeat protein